MKLNLEDPLFKKTKAADFIELIEYFAKDSQGKPVSEVLSAILDESGYEEMLRTEGSQERLDDLAELKQSILSMKRRRERKHPLLTTWNRQPSFPIWTARREMILSAS